MKSRFQSVVLCTLAVPALFIGLASPVGAQALIGSRAPSKSAAAVRTASGTKSTRYSVPLSGDLLDGVSCTSSAGCTAVGYGQTAKGGTFPFADKWTGSAWTSAPSTSLGADPHFGMSAVSCGAPNRCEAVSSYNLATTAKSDQVLLAAGWNGSSWQLQDVPVPAPLINASLNGISCVSAVICEAVGTAETEHDTRSFAASWNGKTWKYQSTELLASGAAPDLDAVSCVSSRDCEAVGQYNNSATGRPVPLAEKWDGASWSVQPSAATSLDTAFLRSVSCTSTEDCEAVGFDFEYKGGGFAEAWNGHIWQHQAVPQPSANATSTVLSGVSCPVSGNCEAVGYAELSTGAEAPIAELWAGSAWQPQSAPYPQGSNPIDLNSVSCAGARSCEAVGEYRQGSSGWHTFAEGWNGSAWTLQATPSVS